MSLNCVSPGEFKIQEFQSCGCGGVRGFMLQGRTLAAAASTRRRSSAFSCKHGRVRKINLSHRKALLSVARLCMLS